MWRPICNRLDPGRLKIGLHNWRNVRSCPSRCPRTMTMAAVHTLYLVDAHSLIFQVFHALPEMSSPSGQPTNALFGFTKDLLALRDRKPEYLICAFDVSGPTFRDQLFTAYKANRSPMPDDLQPQIPMIRE